ncbi:hypothetical protein [Streptomyces sp. NPDC005930]|uniref:cupin domain-containing protein n=1 Tax=Streptomyces sp. NPDC005930 TaxID=3364736 RepID=UPI0036C343B6
MRTTLEPGVDAGEFSPHAPGSHEYVAVEQGCLRLTVGGVTHRLQARRGRTFLTGTRISGTAALRARVLHPGTTKDDLTVLLNEIRAAAREVTT